MIWHKQLEIDKLMFYAWQLENLLLDTAGNIKVSDFGLSAISEQVKVISHNYSKVKKKGSCTIYIVSMSIDCLFYCVCVSINFNSVRLMDYYILHVEHLIMLLLR